MTKTSTPTLSNSDGSVDTARHAARRAITARAFTVGAIALVVGATAGPADAAEQREPESRHVYERQTTPCLSVTDRLAIKDHLEEQRTFLRAEGLLPPVDDAAIVLFDWPVQPKPGFEDFGYYGISNFVDLDPDFPDELLDYNCGDRTYDLDSGYNHQGIDIFNFPFSWLKMDNSDVQIIAAAAGVILDKFDGNFDRSCGFGGGTGWNAVYVEHADGSIAWYGHMKEGSTTYKDIGDPVAAGEYLGIIGSSGNSTGPHLHLEVYDPDGNLVEPFAGPCNNLNDDSWWNDQRPYYDSAINSLRTHDASPETPSCPDPEIPHHRDAFLQGEAIRFSAYYKDILDTQTTDFSVRRPDDTEQWVWSLVSDAEYYAAAGWIWSDTLPGDADLGTWKFKATYDGTDYTHNFRVCDDPGGPPSIDCPSDLTVECGMTGGTSGQHVDIQAFLADVTGGGSCDLTPTFTNDAPGFFPLGTTTVNFTATDDFGSQSMCSADIIVEDTTDPEITCPSDVTVECSEHGGTPDTDPVIAAMLNGAIATDICDPNPVITHDAPAFFELGETVVTFTATDASGNTDTCTASVFVEDTTPPTIEFELSQYILWPPNHKMVDITAEVVVEDICDPDPEWVLTTIDSNEDDNGLGDGDFPNDIQDAEFGTPDVAFALRAERMGGGVGRRYTIRYTVTDMSGNSAYEEAEVVVPHDRSGFAIAGRGFDPEMDALDPGAEEYSLIVPGSSGLSVEDISAGHAQVMNDIGALLPLSYALHDRTGDGMDDLEIFYESASTEALAGHPDATLPLAFLYRRADGYTYILPDIFVLGAEVGVDDVAPASVALMSPTPNPFRRSTRISYEVPAGFDSRVSLNVFDVSGRKVRELVDAKQAPGIYSVTWDRKTDGGKTVSSGIYYLRQTLAGGDAHVARLIVLE